MLKKKQNFGKASKDTSHIYKIFETILAVNKRIRDS